MISRKHCTYPSMWLTAMERTPCPDGLTTGAIQLLFPALPALFPPLFFLYIKYSTSSTIWGCSSSSCSRDKRHGTQLKPGAPHILTKHQLLGASHLVVDVPEQPLTPEMIFQLVTEHKRSFSINSGNPILPKCPSNNCTSSSEILSEKTLAQLYPAHRLAIFCSKCQSLLQTTVQVHSEIFQQLPSVTQTSCYQRQGEMYSHRTINHLLTQF